VNVEETLADEKLFAPLFRPLDSWWPWRTVLRATFGLPLDAAQRKLFADCTGRVTPPDHPARELWCVVGRRGGKSRVAALIATYLAAFKDYSSVLAHGEQGVVMLIASDRNQARVLFGYVSALFSTPMLEPLVVKRWTDALFLQGGVSIEVATASFRSTRGFTVLGAVLDEVAYWRGTDETSANEDAEVLAALRPAMATVPGALLVGISSPYAKRGVLWSAYDKHYAKDGDDSLVWRAPSLTMNPTLDPAVVEQALAEDEPRARAEYLAEFRTDVEAFVSLEVVRACILPSRAELPPMRSVHYRAFTDPSGGSADSWTLAIGHKERERLVVDCIRERRAPFVPTEVAAEYAALCKAYHVTEVTGDRYAGEWPREAFKAHGVRYVPSERTKSELYQSLLPVLNGRSIDLPDEPRLTAQLVGLERYSSRGGRDTIDHRRGSHDDLANAVAGVAFLCSEKRGGLELDRGDYFVRSEGDEIVFTAHSGREIARATEQTVNQVEAWVRGQFRK
jgi:hypothetical protein